MCHPTERLALLRIQFDDIAFSEATRCKVHTAVHSVLLSHFVARDTHLLCKHLSLPFPFLSRTTSFRRSLHRPRRHRPRRRLIRMDTSSNGASSGTRDTCVPHRPDTCRAQCRRRARRTHGTLMVTVTDHVGARIFSPSRRSSRIHHRNSDTLGRGVNNDCVRGLKLLLKRALTIETN